MLILIYANLYNLNAQKIIFIIIYTQLKLSLIVNILIHVNLYKL